VTLCLFVSDLHGRRERYLKLLAVAEAEEPAAVFLGGDLLGPWFGARAGEAVQEGFDLSALAAGLRRVRETLGARYPRVFLILGNDDCRTEEPSVVDGGAAGLWEYLHCRSAAFEGFVVYGYNCVPPTPFPLKDWERYDVSRYVDPGCVSPEEGYHTAPLAEGDIRFATIAKDLDVLLADAPMGRAIFLFHSPPYDTALDRAALDGKMVDLAPVDVHVGSIAIRRVIEARQPLLTLHGHVHESARLSGSWKARIGRTVALSAAHDGPELALVRFDPQDPGAATRALL
jgi:Icc-related predicted phosphoesterase